jgi:thiol:disulfide interchange protein
MPEAARARRADVDELYAERPARPDLQLVRKGEDMLGERPVYTENGRRTVRITGHPTPARRRRSTTTTQLQARPDRIALWAFALGLFLVFMAVVTAGV